MEISATIARCMEIRSKVVLEMKVVVVVRLPRPIEGKEMTAVEV